MKYKTIYSDGNHVAAYTLSELHGWAKQNNVKRSWFHGYNKGHPHYDLPKNRKEELLKNITRVSSKELLTISKTSKIYENSSFA